MQKPESVMENDMYKLLRDLDIQTFLLITFRRQELVMIKNEKRTSRIVYFVVRDDSKKKLKGNEKNHKYHEKQ